MEFAAGSFLALHRSGAASAQYEVETISERLVRNSNFDIKRCDQALPCGRVRNAVEDRIEGKQRIAGEIHLSNEPGRKARPEKTEVDMLRPPRIMMIAPRIRARLHRHEAIRAVDIGHHSADSREVRIERRFVLVAVVSIAARGIGLPNLH